jgi:hypothetical protein
VDREDGHRKRDFSAHLSNTNGTEGCIGASSCHLSVIGSALAVICIAGSDHMVFIAVIKPANHSR